MSEQRRLSDEERDALRAQVLTAIEREGRQRHGRRVSIVAIGGVLLAVALGVAAVKQDTTAATDSAGDVPVRCAGASDAAGENLVTAGPDRDPRLVCGELWRRSELIGATRKPDPAGACAQTSADGVLVLVYADPAEACRVGGGA